jgi:hypothetical protein
MHIRRPLAAVLTALALFGGGATVTACGQAAGQDQNDGTTDDSVNTSGNDPSDKDQGNLPDNSDPQQGSEDQNDDTNDPD